MASTNTKKFPQDDAASAARSTSTAFTEATSAAAADAPPFTAVAAASTSEAPSWAPRSSASPPPALPSERPQERGPELPGAGTGGGLSSYAARVDLKGKKVAACEEAATWSRGSLLKLSPASHGHEVKLLRGKGFWTDDGSCSTSRCGSAIINEKKSYNTETTGNLPIQTLQGKSAQGSRYWELHDCPSNVDGMNPPGFSSPHPVWEGFAVPVKKEGGKLSFFCVACKKLLSGNAAAATKHMLLTKGCAISEEGKMDLKTRIGKFEDRRNDLKRKRKEPKEGVVQDPVRGVIPNNTMSLQGAETNKNTDDGLDQLPGTTECGSSALHSYSSSCGGPEGATKATPGQLERDKDQVSISEHCSHLHPTGLEDIFRLVTDRWPEPDDGRISSFPLSHSFHTAQTFVLCPAAGSNEDLFLLAARQEPEDNHASSSYSSSCNTARTKTLTVCPSTGDEGSEAGEEYHQDQVSALDPLSSSRPTDDHFH